MKLKNKKTVIGLLFFFTSYKALAENASCDFVDSLIGSSVPAANRVQVSCPNHTNSYLNQDTVPNFFYISTGNESDKLRKIDNTKDKLSFEKFVEANPKESAHIKKVELPDGVILNSNPFLTNVDQAEVFSQTRANDASQKSCQWVGRPLLISNPGCANKNEKICVGTVDCKIVDKTKNLNMDSVNTVSCPATPSGCLTASACADTKNTTSFKVEDDDDVRMMANLNAFVGQSAISRPNTLDSVPPTDSGKGQR